MKFITVQLKPFLLAKVTSPMKGGNLSKTINPLLVTAEKHHLSRISNRNQICSPQPVPQYLHSTNYIFVVHFIGTRWFGPLGGPTFTSRGRV